MAKAIHCPRCGFDGYTRTVTPGSFGMELFLWLLFLLPGLIYGIWRLAARYQACPKCGEKNWIPIEMYRAQLQTQAPAAVPSGKGFCQYCGTPRGDGQFCAGCGKKFPLPFKNAT